MISGLMNKNQILTHQQRYCQQPQVETSSPYARIPEGLLAQATTAIINRTGNAGQNNNFSAPRTYAN